MNKRIFNYRFILLVVIIGLFYFITELFIQDIKNDRYTKFANEYKKQLKTLIQEKRNTTDIIALSMSNNLQLKEALLKNDHTLLDISKHSKLLRNNSDFKNVWFQVTDKNGVSFKRSWTKKKGDSLIDIRLDINLMLLDPKIMSTISTGKFDMTFKAMVPVWHDGKLIGIFETITHFNSIAKKLNAQNIDGVFLVDKSYKKQITKPFTKLFVKDYYVANKNVKSLYLKYLEKQNLEEFLDFKDDFRVDEELGKFITLYELPDKNGNKMGHLLLFKNLSEIKIPIISTIREIFVFSSFILVLFMLILNLYFINKKNAKTIEKNNKKLKSLNTQNILKIKELEQQKDKTHKIFNAQPTITIITDGKTIHDANKSFFRFFDQYNDLEAFIEEHECICDFFEKVPFDNYISEKVIDGKSWIEYVLSNPTTTFKGMMKKDEKEHHFIITANKSSHIEEDGKALIVVTFLDITQEFELNNDLRQKDKILMQQSKLASMGEMIGNIAHQWRQPLSVISTSASLLSIKDQYSELKEEDVNKYLDSILENTQYLSKTIDDFKDYFKPDKKSKSFEVTKTIEKALFLIEVKFKNKNIDVIKNISACRINGFENELIQVLMNLLNNAKDVLEHKKEIRKFIFIDCSCDNEFLYIHIKDSGGGIDKDIIDRIFEPYFTTKHKSKGTGIGLYMVDQMVTKHMRGSIDVKNSTFTYESEIYNGAQFSIKLPC